MVLPFPGVDNCVRKKRVVWKEDGKAAEPHIPADDVPFIVVRNVVLECEFGKDWEKKKKDKRKDKKQQVYFWNLYL